MDAVREQLKKPLVVGIGGFVVGLILGWIVIGWGLWPVQWTDATAQHLRQDLKEDYLRMSIDSYALNNDATLAKQRYEALGPDADQVMQAVVNDPQTQALAVAFAAAVQVEPGAVSPIVPGVMETPSPEAAPKPSSANLIRNVIMVMCGAVLLIAAGLVVLYFLRQRQVRERVVSPTFPDQPTSHEAEWSDYEPSSQEPPMVQFMASYKLGDDLFDDSFSIDSPAGEFLGECGVGISETIGVGDPKKVTAFEAWLFDKNDIQTVTKVLMSEHAYHDEGIYQRLSAKGEPILAEPGAQIVLETQTLQMAVRVVDMGYGDGALPPQSFFDRLVLELAVWSKV